MAVGCVCYIYIAKMWRISYLVPSVEPPSPDKLEVCTIYNLMSQTNLAYINWNVSYFHTKLMRITS